MLCRMKNRRGSGLCYFSRRDGNFWVFFFCFGGGGFVVVVVCGFCCCCCCFQAVRVGLNHLIQSGIEMFLALYGLVCFWIALAPRS